MRALVRRLLHNARRSLNWSIVGEGEPTQDQLPKWEDLPTAGNFKVAYPGGRSSKARASDLEKENQRKKYSKYLRWASECCGVTKTKFDEMLEHSRSIGKAGRETALKELPRFLRAVGQKQARGELPYAVLWCRAEGLRRAAMQPRSSSAYSSSLGRNAARRRNS